MKGWIAPIVCACVFALTFGIFSVVTGANASDIADARAELAAVQNRVATLSAASKETNASIVHETTGLSAKRVSEDTLVAEALLSKICSWSSYEEYELVRQDLAEKYGCDPNGGFLSTFMPELPSDEWGGETFNLVDTLGYNVSFRNMKPMVTDIKLDKYSYFTLVTMSSSTDKGQEAEGQAAFIYTVDSDGNIGDLAGYPLT